VGRGTLKTQRAPQVQQMLSKSSVDSQYRREQVVASASKAVRADPSAMD